MKARSIQYLLCKQEAWVIWACWHALTMPALSKRREEELSSPLTRWCQADLAISKGHERACPKMQGGLGTVAHAFNLSALEAEAGESHWVQGHPVQKRLQNYKENPVLKNTKKAPNKTKQKKKAKQNKQTTNKLDLTQLGYRLKILQFNSLSKFKEHSRELSSSSFKYT